eukprot:CAMPEP_0183502678 /NCGR_PEP_ID=MMETSP0371-20130417/4406_1 /TAXON_ID=268820 /ORGANISM="Peridinium aciculiferum, Strain PAER-2" /LENGTH=78 /DNA_ID=CAMNT_0025697459 /DNA_START=139 /DNA_END=373 /DNA_ORIENTATION=+
MPFESKYQVRDNSKTHAIKLRSRFNGGGRSPVITASTPATTTTATTLALTALEARVLGCEDVGAATGALPISRSGVPA